MELITIDDELNSISAKSFKVFLAGNMSPWRKELIKKLDDYEFDITVIDPTVDDWDSQIGKTDADNPAFIKQTDWEHAGLIKADMEVFWFDGSSLAPVSLFELGSYKTHNTVIMLSDEYEKAGYIRYISRRFGLSIVHSLTELELIIRVRYLIYRREQSYGD